MNGYTRKRRGLRRVLGLSLGSAMIVAMAPGVASAQTAVPDARSTDNVCDDLEDYDRDRFDDTRGSSHERNVLCMADWGLTEGLRGGDSYGPRLDVNRGQMASFIARFIEEYTGEELEEGEGFRDVPDSYVHSENINKIEAVGVTEGTRRSGGEEFDPLADVTRGQMASFIARALTYIEDEQGQPETVPPRTDENYFPDDDGSVHEDNINALADVGIVQGFDDGTYRPLASVKRDQMASFVMRAFDYAVDEDLGFFGPEFASSTPEDGATDVPVDTTVTGTFDRTLGAGSEIELECDDDDIVGASTFAGDTITFTPAGDLPYEAECIAWMTAVDAEDDSASLWSIEFTTEDEPDTTPPTFVSSDPANEEDDVAVDVTPSATFDEALSDDSTATLVCDTENVAGVVSVDGATVIFTPTDDLDSEAECIFTVTAEDLAGNEAAPVVIEFTVEDVVAPLFVSSAPEDGDDDVAIDVAPSATYDEDLSDDSTATLVCDGDDVAGVVSVDGETLTFTPTEELENDVECTFTVNAEDEAGNEAEVEIIVFTTIAANGGIPG